MAKKKAAVKKAPAKPKMPKKKKGVFYVCKSKMYPNSDMYVKTELTEDFFRGIDYDAAVCVKGFQKATGHKLRQGQVYKVEIKITPIGKFLKPKPDPVEEEVPDAWDS
jgi:hypothetical protein